MVIDVTSDESVKAAAETLATKITALDVLVNNAGVLGAGFKGALEETISETLETYSVNVFGVIRTTSAFLELMKKSKSGRIVNVSSFLGSLTLLSDKNFELYNTTSLSYNSSKAALNMITISYAKALAPFGIKVNTVDPGYTATDINANTGPQSVEVGAQSTITAATFPDDGPTGTYFNKDGPLPW